MPRLFPVRHFYFFSDYTYFNIIRMFAFPCDSEHKAQEARARLKMDAQVLLRINAQEERFLPVEIKVGMLMEQAAMRMRASAIVGDRIAKLDDAIRVRALLAIIREKTSGCGQGSSSSASDDADGKREGSSNPSSPVTTACRAGVVCASQPGEEDNDIFTRMAVSAMKTVLFQISEESKPESAKDVEDLYEGLVTTAELSLAAAEGFPTLDVDSLMSLKQARYRKLAAARHRFLVSLCKLILWYDMTLQSIILFSIYTSAVALVQRTAGATTNVLWFLDRRLHCGVLCIQCTTAVRVQSTVSSIV